MEINYNDSFVEFVGGFAWLVFEFSIAAAFIILLVMIYLAFFKGDNENE